MATRDKKPKFNTARGEAELSDKDLPSSFRFEGVTARVFPLKADMHCLRHFCRTYYNIVPDNIADFRPVLPYVYLAVLHYGKMFSQETHRTWVSQHEVAFIIPLEWCREEYGRMVFVDWAYAVPFIFVDDDISLTLGREVYGWPKIAAQIDQEIDPWLSHPRQRTHLMTLSTAGFLSASVRKKEKLRKLLDIDLAPPPTFSQLRPDLNPFDLLLRGPRVIPEALAMGYDWLEVLAGLAIPGFSRPFDQQGQSYQQVLPRMVAKGLRNLGALWSDLPREQIVNALLPGVSYSQLQSHLLSQFPGEQREEPRSGGAFSLNQITMKQFRDAPDPYNACYQALINSKMEITNTKNGGLLGDVNLLRGDPTGGFQLRLHYRNTRKHSRDTYKDTGEQILKELGLEVAKEQKADDYVKELGLEVAKEQKADDHFVATLKPIYPFWTEVDLHYGQAETLCWRAHTSDWSPASTPEAIRPEDPRARK